MVDVLRESEIGKAFREATRHARQIDIAVPFWGKGAIKTLGLVRGQPVRVVCNLDQPGCNPTVIAAICELGIKVKTHPRLHAKLYATPEFAIVGSSNVSTNGMMDEGVAAVGWIEANAASNAPEFVEAVQSLFDEIWSDATRVTPAAIKRALASRPLPTARSVRAPTLLAACREEPAAFDMVFVAPYTEDLSEEAGLELRAVKKAAAPPQPEVSWSNFRKADGYQFGDIPEGAWLLGLDCRPGRAPRYTGCSRATGLQIPIAGQTVLDVVLPARITLDGRRFRLSATEKAELAGVATKLLHKGLTSLQDAIKLIDRAR